MNVTWKPSEDMANLTFLMCEVRPPRLVSWFQTQIFPPEVSAFLGKVDGKRTVGHPTASTFGFKNRITVDQQSMVFLFYI